jgi:phage-related baseplate assembly protein
MNGQDLDLGTLPAPTVIEPLSFEAILAAERADLLQRYPAAADVIDLESEPLQKLLQAHAYREMLFRQRVNEAARAHLLAFATGADLDHKGAFYGLPRLPDELDERYRRRIALRIRALAGNGTREHYELAALTATLNVRDALTTSPRPGRVRVLLWLIDPAQADASAHQVMAALNAEANRPLGVPVEVAVAQPRPINITARIWREAHAPADLVAQLRTSLGQALARYARLGRGVPRSWVTTQLHAPGVAAVRYLDNERPAETTPLASDEYPVLGQLDLRDEGVSP